MEKSGFLVFGSTNNMETTKLIPVENEKNQFVTEDGYIKIIKFPATKIVKLFGVKVNGKESDENFTLLYEEIEALHKLINE